MDKEQKKEYDKTCRNLVVRLSEAEDIVLHQMMKDEGWENASGFFKDKVFGNRVNKEYAKIICKADPADIQSLMQILMDDHVKQLTYVNYCLKRELQDLKDNHKTGQELSKKLVRCLMKYCQRVIASNDRVSGDIEEVLKRLNIKVEKRKVDNVELLPDSVIDHAFDDWEHTQTPEAFEAVRRSFLKFNAQQQKILKERIKEEKKNKEK